MPPATRIDRYRHQFTVRELAVTYRARRTRAAPEQHYNLRAPRDTTTLIEQTPVLRGWLIESPVERFVAFHLTIKLQLLSFELLTSGIIDQVVIDPRRLFQGALLANAATVITVHNHPSGDPQPSMMDRRCWDRLDKAGDLLGVPVLDHMIIGHDRRYYSARERGC